VDEPRRTDVFDRELKRALAATGGAAPGAHVDAELAAAWMDRRLDAAEARSIEAHLADCQDCQTLMATLARLAPGGADAATAGAAPAWWRRLRGGWVVPATVAAAAALVIWVVVPQQQAGSTPSERAQASEPAAAERSQAREPDAAEPAAGEPSAAEPARAAAPPVANAPEADAADARRLAQAAPAVESQRKAESEPAPARPSAAAQQPPPAAAPAPPVAPPASPASPDLERRERRADASTPARPSTLNDTVGLESKQSAADAQSPKATVAGESAVRQEAAAPAPGAAAEGVAGGVSRESFSRVAGLRASGALAIVAPDGGARWRRTGTVIEFARRANADFTAVTLPVPASTVTAGASPGGTVCWLAGTAGTVLVTADGLRFTRVASPAPVDLAAITAADARTAVVTATDGRRFRTTDQGATWAPLP
jgi:hypothetical protein